MSPERFEVFFKKNHKEKSEQSQNERDVKEMYIMKEMYIIKT